MLLRALSRAVFRPAALSSALRVLLPVVCATTGWAQAASTAADTAERVQREQQDRQREDLRRARESARPPTLLTAPLPVAPRGGHAGEAKRVIRQLVLEGADHLRPKFRAQLEQRYTGELGISDVEQLLTDLTRHYVLRGYATTRAYLPEQDLASGVLRVKVVEGRVERIEGAHLRANIFPAAKGDLLNLRPLEQGIDNLNRLASNNAALDLQPGSQPGDTIVAVKNQPGRRWRASGSFDSTGSSDTGRDQASGTFTLEDPLGFADSLTVNHRRAVPYHANSKASEATNVSYSAPWGWHLLTVGGAASTYAMTTAPSGYPLPFDGRSCSVFGRLDRSLYRSATARLDASATLNWRSSKNYLFGTLISVSSRDTTSVDVDLNYSTSLLGGTFTASAGLGWGLPLFGALSDPRGLVRYAPHAEYLKGTFSLSFTRPLVLDGRTFVFSSALNGQYSPRVLYGTDQLTVGGLYSVRGFDKSVLAGDSGYVWRNDLSLPLAVPAPVSGRLGSRLGLRPYVGIDHGYAWSSVTGLPALFSPIEGFVAGGVAGTAVSLGRMNADFSYHHSLVRPSGLPGESGRFYFRVGFSF